MIPRATPSAAERPMIRTTATRVKPIFKEVRTTLFLTFVFLASTFFIRFFAKKIFFEIFID